MTAAQLLWYRICGVGREQAPPKGHQSSLHCGTRFGTQAGDASKHCATVLEFSHLVALRLVIMRVGQLLYLERNITPMIQIQK